MSRIAISVICGVFSLCLAAVAAAAVEHLPEDVRTALEQTSDFQSFTSVSAIPDAVGASFAVAVRDKAFAMAEPGAKWQDTDLVLEKDLPWRRLQSGAVSRELLLLFYEHGGYAHSYHVCVFRLTTHGAQLVWHADRPRDVASAEDLNRAIRTNAVSDDPEFLF